MLRCVFFFFFSCCFVAHIFLSLCRTLPGIEGNDVSVAPSGNPIYTLYTTVIGTTVSALVIGAKLQLKLIGFVLCRSTLWQ